MPPPQETVSLEDAVRIRSVQLDAEADLALDFSRPERWCCGVARSFLLNHWYHHRGQLSVYLRMLDVPLPSVYGPTADENPFA